MARDTEALLAALERNTRAQERLAEALERHTAVLEHVSPVLERVLEANGVVDGAEARHAWAMRS